MKKFIVQFLALLLTSSICSAQDAFVIPGSKPGTNSGLVSYSNGSTFSVRTLFNRSVYCRYRGNVSDDIGFSETLSCPSGNCPTARLVGDADGGIDTLVGPDDAISFLSNEEDSRYTITMLTAPANPAVIECFDTTLFGNFNTVAAANPFNFLELSNDSGIDINTRISVIRNDGIVLDRLIINVPAAEQRDISIHDITGASNTFGRIYIANDGAIGGLRARLTKYTSSFAITDSIKFETRRNQQ